MLSCSFMPPFKEGGPQLEWAYVMLKCSCTVEKNVWNTFGNSTCCNMLHTSLLLDPFVLVCLGPHNTR